MVEAKLLILSSKVGGSVASIREDQKFQLGPKIATRCTLFENY